MKKKNINIEYSTYDSIECLNSKEQQLINEAIKAAENAYAPYSKFKVGAALLLENDQIITGSNQENAAYPSGLCAERVALFYAGAKYPNTAIKNMVIVSIKDGELVKKIVAPCGACRQVINETAHRHKKSFPLILAGKQGVIKIDNANNLLPLAFGPEDL